MREKTKHRDECLSTRQQMKKREVTHPSDFIFSIVFHQEIRFVRVRVLVLFPGQTAWKPRWTAIEGSYSTVGRLPETNAKILRSAHDSSRVLNSGYLQVINRSNQPFQISHGNTPFRYPCILNGVGLENKQHSKQG